MSYKDITEEVNKYYTEKVKTYGATPKGVDWNGEESQQLRFKELLTCISDQKDGFSILDYGCGYGSLFGYMNGTYQDFKYTGFDISEEMIDKGKSLYNDDRCDWASEEGKLVKHDFVIASGIFNVRMQTPDHEWKNYIIETLHKMNDLAIKGFAFNLLTSYSDKEYMRDYLYYADPTFFFDYCKRNFSRYVGLLHDYPLYEFSMLVKK